jgi:serine protease Do
MANSKRLRLSLMAALLAGSTLSGAAIMNAYAATPAPVNSAVNPPAAMVHMPDFADLVGQVKPAVVSITVKMQATAEAAEGPMQFMPMQPERRRMVEARGSGFIVDPSGTVITNNHVVKDAKSVSIMLDDGTELAAKVIGRDERTDLAVLKVDAGSRVLPYIQLGDSAAVRPGEWVVAMGNPFGLGGTVTAGIVSAKGRDIGAGPYDQFIQIDAPINQGNSGGPLFNQEGKVVGVNSAILSPSGGSIGIGFAIPANVVKDVVAELEKHGHVTRGYAGVETQSIAPAMAKALKLPNADGALVAGLTPDSPAAKAGIEAGDVIRAVNDKAVKNPHDLATTVGAAKPGDNVKLEIFHDGASRTVSFTLAQMPSDRQVAAAEDGAQGRAKVGIALAELSPEIRGQLDLPKGTKGAVVREVQPGSPAQDAGIRPGDVIVGVGPQPVTSPEDAVKAIRSASKDQSVALRILRDGKSAFVAIDLTAGNTDKG